MQRIQRISLDQKANRHSLVTDIAQKNLQVKGIPVLLWSGLSMCCSCKVSLSSLFSEERNRHAQEFPVIKKNCNVGRTGSQKQCHVPCILLSVSVVLQSVFVTPFFFSPPRPPLHQIALRLQKIWLTHGFTDFKARRNYCEPLICVSGNQNTSVSSSCSKSMDLGKILLVKWQPPFLWVCSDNLFD